MLFHIYNLTSVLSVEVTAQKPCPQVTSPNANPSAILKTPTFNVQSPQASNFNGTAQTQSQTQAADPAAFQEFCMHNFNELKDAIQNMTTKKPQTAQISNEFSECMQKLYKFTLPCKKCHACTDKGECNTSLIREIFTQTEGEVKKAKEFFTEIKKNMFMFNQIKAKIFKIQQMIRCDPTDGCLTCDLLAHKNLTFIINYLAALFTGESFSMFDLMARNSTENASISGMIPLMCNFTKKDNSNDTEESSTKNNFMSNENLKMMMLMNGNNENMMQFMMMDEMMKKGGDQDDKMMQLMMMQQFMGKEGGQMNPLMIHFMMNNN